MVNHTTTLVTAISRMLLLLLLLCMLQDVVTVLIDDTGDTLLSAAVLFVWVARLAYDLFVSVSASPPTSDVCSHQK